MDGISEILFWTQPFADNLRQFHGIKLPFWGIHICVDFSL